MYASFSKVSFTPSEIHSFRGVVLGILFICYLFSEGSLEFYYVRQAGIKLVILLPQHQVLELQSAHLPTTMILFTDV